MYCIRSVMIAVSSRENKDEVHTTCPIREIIERSVFP